MGGGRIPDSVIDEVHRRADIIDIVGSYVKLTRRGNRWWGLCPFHSEKTPSFAVSQENNLYYCFGCGKGGNVVNFLMDIASLSFPEAMDFLAQKTGVDIHLVSSNEQTKSNIKALEDLYLRVAKTFHWLLYNHPHATEARDYLESRGINRETSEVFSLGWAPSDGQWLYGFLMEKKYSAQFLATSGLFSSKSPKWSFFVDRLMFPVMPDMGRVIAFSGRGLNDKGPKYKNSPETALYKKSLHLYGLGQAKKSIRDTKRAVICEGNLDVLSCYQSGIKEAVAPLGTALTENQTKTLKRLTQTIVLMFDGDEAGIDGTMRAALLAEEQGLNVQAVSIPPGMDPADLMKEKGEVTLHEIASKPLTVFDFLLHCKVRENLEVTAERQERTLIELTPYLRSVGSEVRREAYLKRLADRLNADPLAVIREFHNSGSRQQRIRHTKVTENLMSDELYLMIAVAIKADFFSPIRAVLAPEMFRDRRALVIYRIMDEMSVNGIIPSTENILEKLDDNKLREVILEKLMTEEFTAKAEETINEKISLIKVRTLNEERRALVSTLSNDSNRERTTARMKRIQEIDRNITRIRQGRND